MFVNSLLVRAITLGGFGSVPVLANDGTVVGLVSEFDLLKTIMEGKQLWADTHR
jgi:CBS domain-containing protein